MGQCQSRHDTQAEHQKYLRTQDELKKLRKISKSNKAKIKDLEMFCNCTKTQLEAKIQENSQVSACAIHQKNELEKQIKDLNIELDINVEVIKEKDHKIEDLKKERDEQLCQAQSKIEELEKDATQARSDLSKELKRTRRSWPKLKRVMGQSLLK